MRFLIVFSAALACAAAAPSHLVPFAPYTVQAVALPAALPTISSGDLQAAAIDAHVKAADLAQEAIDKARLASDQAAEDFNAKSITNVDQEKERLAEGFWSIEDKKWQALDAIKTAEAQIDGAIASKADILAKTAVVAPYVAAAVPAVAPIAPVAPVVYSGYVAPGLKSFSSQTLIQTHPAEAAKVEGESEKVEAAVKAVEPAAVKAAEPAAEKAEAEAEKPAEAAAKAAAELKSEADKAFAALQAPVIAPVAVAGAFPYAGYTGAYPYSGLAVAPVALAQPGFKYATTIQHSAIPHATFLKTQW